jgi:hypothetical protein
MLQMTRSEVASDNLAVLTNAAELSAEIIKRIAGNAIANTVDGKPISDVYLKDAIASRMHSKVVPFLPARG